MNEIRKEPGAHKGLCHQRPQPNLVRSRIERWEQSCDYACRRDYRSESADERESFARVQELEFDRLTDLIAVRVFDGTKPKINVVRIRGT
jgi:hypothetical protein